MRTSISVAKPPNASSAALSMTSWQMWVGLSVRVYMPGRSLTGSKPLRTVMLDSLYWLFLVIGEEVV